MAQEGKYVNHTPKKRHRKSALPVVLVLLVVALVVVLAVVLTRGHGKTAPDPGTSTSGASTCEITTPVGQLQFPSELAQYVEAEESTSGAQYTATFYGTVGKDRVLLFALSVGPDGTGYQLGSAPDKSGERQLIWLDITQLQADSAWTSEQTDLANTLQSCVNDLIEQLYAVKGFQEGAQ